jgi:hypothetical protein
MNTFNHDNSCLAANFKIIDLAAEEIEELNSIDKTAHFRACEPNWTFWGDLVSRTLVPLSARSLRQIVGLCRCREIEFFSGCPHVGPSSGLC